MSVNHLLKTISPKTRLKTLSAKDELRLGTIIQDPKTPVARRQDAINTLVIKNVYLVLKMAPKYNRKEFEFDDIVGYGIVGLFTAARKYDPTTKFRFATYARHWIKESIMKAVREYSGSPKIPVFLVKDLWQVSRALAKNDIVSDDELAKVTKLSVEEAIHFRSLIFKVVQFDPEYVQVEDPVTPEEVYCANERSKILMSQLHSLLTPQEFEVIAHAFGLDGCTRMSLSQIQTDLGIQNARKLKASAFDKLRQCDVLKTLLGELRD